MEEWKRIHDLYTPSLPAVSEDRPVVTYVTSCGGQLSPTNKERERVCRRGGNGNAVASTVAVAMS